MSELDEGIAMDVDGEVEPETLHLLFLMEQLCLGLASLDGGCRLFVC